MRSDIELVNQYIIYILGLIPMLIKLKTFGLRFVVASSIHMLKILNFDT